MTGTELLLLTAALVIPVLTYFAGVQRGKRLRTEDAERNAAERREDEAARQASEREIRIRDAVRTYVANTARVANMAGALRSGVASFADWAEVKEFCDRIDAAGETPAIPATYRQEIDDRDLLLFFRKLSQTPGWRLSDGVVRQLIAELKDSTGEAAV